MREQLRSIIHTRATKAGRAFDLIVQLLILMAVFVHSLETIQQFEVYLPIFYIIDNIFLGLFTLEYLLRVYSSKERLKFIFSFYGIIDLLAIAPGLIRIGILDLTFLRLFRLLRVFTGLKLLRYSRATRRLFRAFIDIKEELISFSLITFLMLYVSAAGIYYFEHPAQPDVFSSIPQSLWWAVATFTTVGYGDAYPITSGGKIFTGAILLIGVGIVAIPSALLAAALTKKS